MDESFQRNHFVGRQFVAFVLISVIYMRSKFHFTAIYLEIK